MDANGWSDVIGPWTWELCKIEGKCMHRYIGDACTWTIFTENPKLNIRVTLRNGFVTDGASTPKLFQCVLNDWYGNEKDRVAISHDCFYAIYGRGEGNYKLSREESDEILADGCEYVLKKNKLQCFAVKQAVRMFAGGDEHWGNQEPANVNEDGSLKFSVEIVKLD